MTEAEQNQSDGDGEKDRPAEAAIGTIRDLYGASLQNNAVHASANEDDAERELKLVFG